MAVIGVGDRVEFRGFAAVRSPFSGMKGRRSRTEGGREKADESVCRGGVVGGGWRREMGPGRVGG